MKLHRPPIAVLLLPILSVAIAASMTSCTDYGPGYTSVGVSHGSYTSLPRGYSGDAYYHGNRYYHGGRYERGSYNHQGHRYNGRYFHNGKYYYGGQYRNHGSGSGYSTTTRTGRPYIGASSSRRASSGYYSTLPRGYSGDAYRHEGRYYYGDRYERGSYNHQGRW